MCVCVRDGCVFSLCVRGGCVVGACSPTTHAVQAVAKKQRTAHLLRRRPPTQQTSTNTHFINNKITVSVVLDGAVVPPAPEPLTAVGAISHLLDGLHSNALFSDVVRPGAQGDVWVRQSSSSRRQRRAPPA